MSIKKAALLHDMSCFGRCALAVIVPVISALGIQPVIIPTALLSTHTGGFTGYTFLDLTDEIKKITAHHEKLGLVPDCVYTGYLGGAEQAALIRDYIEKQKERGAYIFVDPVMGDDGKLYSSYTKQMQEGMASLAAAADIITPNMTEAFFLLGREYEKPPYSKADIGELTDGLFNKYRNTEKIALTSVELDSGEYGVAYADRSKTEYIFTRRHEINYPGSGDIFSAVVCGGLLGGADFGASVNTAVKFLDKVIEYTVQTGTPVREGLIFEKFLSELLQLSY